MKTTIFTTVRPVAANRLPIKTLLPRKLSSSNTVQTKTYFAEGKPQTVNLVQKRYKSSLASVSSPESNFFSPPDISEYRKPISETDPKNDYSNRAFAYFMVGSFSAVSALGLKNVFADYMVHFSASADVLAMAKVEIDLNSIPEGKNVIIKWRGKPVFVRHRTPDEIQEASQVSISELRDKQTDEQRTKQPEWLVMLGICTHLGCVPIGEAGDYGGWFCPCHGSHYDISGRIRKGPAPYNLEIPEYSITNDAKLIIG